MKQFKHVCIFLTGFLSAVMAMVLIASAGAALTSKTIEVSTDVSIFVDGVKMTDAKGNPIDAFISNGTTYVPLRAVSQYLGKAVKWDGNNRRVYIGEVPGEKQYLRSVCPPYQWEHCYYPNEGYITMAGQKYTNSLWFGRSDHLGGWALFNLNRQYSTLSFDIGHRDGKYMENSQINIYLDGDLAFTVDLTPKMLPTHYEVPLHGALQMEIRSANYGSSYGLANLEIY